MAIFALTSVTTTVGGTNYDDHIKSATLTLDAAQLDTTDFDSGGWVEMIGGLKSGTLSIEFMDDFADGDVDDDLFSKLGTVVTFSVQSTSAATGASNSEYNGSVLVTSVPFGGSVGDLATKSVSWPVTGAVTRDDS